METPEASATNDQSPDVGADTDLPPGDHALEVAARRGIGPLSGLGREVWHGRARPCVSCGQLVLRDEKNCDQCGQDLSEEMLAKMRAHAGPWYVLEHIRPFPGVSLERIVRQIRRGLITETSIVRGPSTDYQWRFALEAPGLCRYFNKCWHCHEKVTPYDTCCPLCSSYLLFEKLPSAPKSVPISKPSDQAAVLPSEDPAPLMNLARLSAAIGDSKLSAHEDVWDAPPRVAGVRATWAVAALLIVVIAVLMWFTKSRSPASPEFRPVTPGLVLPAT